MKRPRAKRTSMLIRLLLAITVFAVGRPLFAEEVLPKPQAPFRGKIRTHGERFNARFSEGHRSAERCSKYPVDLDR